MTKLHVVGSLLACARQDRCPGGSDDWRDTPLDDLTQGCEGTTFLDRQEAYYTRLLRLNGAGLPMAHTLALARVWSQGAAVHLQRAIAMPAGWAQSLDESTVSFLGKLLGCALPEGQARQCL